MEKWVIIEHSFDEKKFLKEKFVCSVIKAGEVEEGDKIMLSNGTIFNVDYIDSFYINDDVAEEYEDGTKDIKPEHSKYEFIDEDNGGKNGKSYKEIPYNAEFTVLREVSDREMEEVEQSKKIEVTEDTSDGYHTFKELYEFRKVYNAALFNEWAKEGKYNVHKSMKHHDGELCFGGFWFIVVAVLPTGQISNHYEIKDWDLFNCMETEKAIFKFDGHTPKDVINRINGLYSCYFQPNDEKFLHKK